MHIIHDDFTLLSKTTAVEVDSSRDLPLKSYDEIAELVAKATTAQTVKPVQGGLSLVISRGLALRGIDRGNQVFREKTAGGMLTSKYTVAIPVAGTQTSGTLRFYTIDTMKQRFVNLGPVNGAVVHAHQSRASYLGICYTQRKFALRVNEGQTTDMTMVVSTAIRDWVCPSSGVVATMSFKNYTIDENPPTYTDAVLALSLPNRPTLKTKAQKRESSRPLRWWALNTPDIRFDMTRPGFPLDEQDLTIAIVALSLQGP